MTTKKQIKKDFECKQRYTQSSQSSLFLIGLAGAIVFISLLNMVIWVNNLVVTQGASLFIFVSLTFLFIFTSMDALLMAILLQYHYGKY